MKIFVALLSVFVAVCQILQVQGQPPTTDLLTGGGCGVTSEVPGGIVVSHQPFDIIPPITNDFSCFFQMRSVRRGQTVRFMFRFFSLSPNDCSMTNLTFYDGRNESFPVIALVCPDSPDVLTREYTSTGRWLTLRLQVSSSSFETRSANFSGFYVSYTEGINPCEDPSIELMCNNGRCVYQILQCDGLDSCGDGTDELTTAPSFCDGTMSDPIVTSDTGLFSNLTPLYIVLTLAFAMFLAYLVYILLSFAWFKQMMTNCMYRCFLFGIRRRRRWKEEEKNKLKSNGKVHPENSQKLNLDKVTEEDIASVPPVTSAPSKSNGQNIAKKKPEKSRNGTNSSKKLPANGKTR